VFLIPLSKPSIGTLEETRLLEVIRSNRLALGPLITEFEERMANVCSVRHAIAVSSGTAALHLILASLDLGPKDEVITTPYSFVASTNAILYTGAQPRFVDIDPFTFNLDPNLVKAAITPYSRALLAVDVFGLPANWPTLTALADNYNLKLIDDACEGLGARCLERPIGSWGTAAAFGFYPNKQITTGEGGCITTNDGALAARCRSMRNHGRGDDAVMEHVRLGYNYRMSELTAALGCAQLERLPELLSKRETIAHWYAEALSPLGDDIVLPPEMPDASRSWFVYVVRLRDHFAEDSRDQIIQYLQEMSIASAPYFPSIHLQPFYRQQFGFKPGDFPKSEAASARTLALPFFPDLTREQVVVVSNAIRSVLPKLSRRHTLASVAPSTSHL